VLNRGCYNLSRLTITKNAKILHKLLKLAGPHSGAWLCDVVELNPSLGMKRRNVYPALDQLAKHHLVSIHIPSLRDPKDRKKLVQGRSLKDLPYLKVEYLENSAISTKRLEDEISRLLLICRNIEDNEFAKGWKNKYGSWNVEQKIAQLTNFFLRINRCFYLLNLLNGIKGLRSVRVSERKELLSYYRVAFKLMKKDRDYKAVWPPIRRLLLGDREPVTMEETAFFSALRMPVDPCICGHLLRDHDDGKKCQGKNEHGIGCDCEQFRLRSIIAQS
jgi:hypothetical protein